MYCYWLTLMQLYVGSVQYVVPLLFASLYYFLLIGLTFFNILCMIVFLFCMFVFYFVYSAFCIVLCAVSPSVYSCLFPIFVQVYGPLPPGGNPNAVSYHFTCRDYSLHQGAKSVGQSVLA